MQSKSESLINLLYYSFAKQVINFAIRESLQEFKEFVENMIQKKDINYLLNQNCIFKEKVNKDQTNVYLSNLSKLSKIKKIY
ncbi:unnamed protein product [Paramecium pentaurelia]|uniref:Uncharacterized protein n=1 Tax=Paramecium pentaurelia TaxID=43138 RepID=A0A8S1VGG8_9CILI|nr:unnamed protein product [Paramecium pentaurelia]